MVCCCLQKKMHVSVAFVPSIKVQLILIKSLNKRLTLKLRNQFFVALQANSSLRPPYCCFSITHTHTHSRTPPNEWSARRRGRYLHNTQQTQRTKSQALSGIRTRDPSHQAASDLRLRQRDHRDRPKSNTHVKERLGMTIRTASTKQQNTSAYLFNSCGHYTVTNGTV